MDNLPAQLSDLILLRLSAAGRPPDRRILEKCLEPYFSERLGLSNGTWRGLVADSLQGIQRDGLIEKTPLRLTQRGQDQISSAWQLKDLPRNSPWLSLRNRVLIARVLDLSPESEIQWKRIGSADGLRTAVLVRFYDLPLEPFCTPTEALNALAQKHAGKTQNIPVKPREREEILREILLAGESGDLKVRLPAVAAGAKGDSIETLRRAVINRWLDQQDGKIHQLPDSQDLQSFAARIEQLARETQSGRFGDDKVFLSHIWNRYQESSEGKGIPRASFDEQLLEANRRDLLTLSRADLTMAMNTSDVEQSEIRRPFATFHFLRTIPRPGERDA